jgi:hypothetical protein
VAGRAGRHELSREARPAEWRTLRPRRLHELDRLHQHRSHERHDVLLRSVVGLCVRTQRRW